jgi:hypothetical protein
MKELGISEFKAKCIDALKTVQETKEPLLITLRKWPIATIHPYREEAPPQRVLGKLKGRIAIQGDIVHTDFADDWEMDK